MINKEEKKICIERFCYRMKVLKSDRTKTQTLINRLTRLDKDHLLNRFLICSHTYLWTLSSSNVIDNHIMFVSTNSKHIVFDVEKKKIFIDNCKELTIKLNVKNFKSTINRVIRVNNVIKISIKFNTTMSFKLRDKKNLFINRDFMFVF